MHRVLVVGSVAYDRIMVFPGHFKDHFIADALHNINVCFSVSPPKEEFGGCAGNIAYNLALLGGTPEMLATAGNDFARYEEWLKENGIATTPLDVSSELPTASAYIVTDEAANQITAFSTGADERSYSKEVDLDGTTFAIVAPTGVEDMRAFPERFRTADIPYLFDPGQQISSLSKEDLVAGITGARALVVNDYELALITEKTGWSEEDILNAAEMLIVTLGAEGSSIRTNEGATHVESVPVKEVVDPTGAGDAFRAGLIHGLVAGRSIQESAQIGSAVAAYAVECYGTQNHRFTIDELKARYEAAYQTSFPA